MNLKLNGLMIAVIAVVALLVVLGGVWLFSAATTNGEVRNPNAGHPTPMPKIQHQTPTTNHTPDEETFRQLLKMHRPNLSDAEVDAEVDKWKKARGV